MGQSVAAADFILALALFQGAAGRLRS